MSVLTTGAPRHASEAPRLDASRLWELLLVRIASEASGIGEADLVRDLHPLVSQVLDRSEWRDLVRRLMATATRDGHVEVRESVVRVTPAGTSEAARMLGAALPHRGGWQFVRDILLVAKALAIRPPSDRRIRPLRKLDGLRCAIVASAFGLTTRGTPTAARLRSGLALIALDRAFGNRLHQELGARSGLSAKAARVLAGQLARNPRDPGTDARLVAQLAADVTGVGAGSLSALRQAVLRSYLGVDALAVAVPSRPARVRREATGVVEKIAKDVVPTADPDDSARPEADARPDPRSFAAAVITTASAIAQGWAGSRKAFISQVFEVISADQPRWRLGEHEFKAMLTEAHRQGLVVLATSDLRDKRQEGMLRASATTYRNTVWHYVRVDA